MHSLLVEGLKPSRAPLPTWPLMMGLRTGNYHIYCKTQRTM